MTRRRRALGALTASVALLAAWACEPGTGGRRAMFDLSVEPAPAPRAFRTALGWDVTLEEACVSVGPIYLYAEAGLSASVRRAYDWFLPSAHAHPGVDHFNGGEVRGEWLEQLALDLTSGERVDLGAREGIAGEARSVTIGLHPPRASALGATTCLRGHQAYVVGVAARGAEAVRFEGGLDIEAVGTKRRIQISADVVIDDQRRLLVTVDPRPWFYQTKFDELTVDPTKGAALIAPGSQASLSWELGVQSAGAFKVENAP